MLAGLVNNEFSVEVESLRVFSTPQGYSPTANEFSLVVESPAGLSPQGYSPTANEFSLGVESPAGLSPQGYSPTANEFSLGVESPAGLSPQGYSPWTSPDDRLVALDTVRSSQIATAPPGGNLDDQRMRVRCPEHS